MWPFALFLLAAPLLAQNSGLDLVLLLEKTPGMPQPIGYQTFRAVSAEDRVAVMTFANRSTVRQPFTNDPKALEQALRRAARHLPGPHWSPKTPPQARLFASLLDAARLFRDRPADPSRRRVILTIFGTEDDSALASLDQVKQALATARIQLYALAVAKFDPLHARDSQIETPPTFPGRTPPVPSDRAPIPQMTLQILQDLAAATGGEAASGEANMPAILRLAWPIPPAPIR